MDSLYEALQRMAQIPGAISIPRKGETAAHTIPLFPGLSVATVPADRPLSQEEVYHEGIHAKGGMPLSALGTLGSYLFGTTQGGMPHAYLSPDEVLAYSMQPSSPETSQDMSTIGSLAKVEGSKTGNPLGSLYLALVEKLARSQR